ncbi:MAG: CYTH domain-containing protein [Treponema sp.]|nr:CYTH domain-containing protein [Candidatus Treponema equifaecale]
MAREIELKIPLTQTQYGEIENYIYGRKPHSELTFTDAKKLFKQDEYFSRFTTRQERINSNEPKVIRIRTEECDGKFQAYFTIKNKQLENGIEVNQEQETFVENPEVLRNMFAQTGFIRWFTKEKKAVSCYCRMQGSQKEYHLELEQVNGLLYVEIEYTKDDEMPENVQKELKLLVEKLGLDSKKRDPRSWVEILNEA